MGEVLDIRRGFRDVLEREKQLAEIRKRVAAEEESRAAAQLDGLLAEAPELAAPKAPATRPRVAPPQEQRDEHRMRLWREAMLRSAPIADCALAWDAVQDTTAVRIVREAIADGFPRHLVLMGPKGVGKTYAALVAVKHWTEPGKGRGGVSWLYPEGLISAVLHAYDDEAPRLARNVVLDEMGDEKSPDLPRALCRLLDRGAHRLVITTNLKPAEFHARYADSEDGSRLLDRLNHRAQAVPLKGKSLRRQDGGF